jgi:hypothetical protein
MPGIVGLIGAQDVGRLAAALKQISYLETYETPVFGISPTLTLGCAGRPSQRDFASMGEEEKQVFVLVYGAIFQAHPQPHRVPAGRILRDYQAGGFRELRESYDGSFVIVVVDAGNQQLHIATDRLGTQPVYYRHAQGCLAFGPEVKALLTASHADGRLSAPGLVNLLITGYNLGDRTLFEDVYALEPGSVLTYALDKGTKSLERYWKIVYDPSPSLARREAAEEALFETTRRAHELHLADQPREFDLLLSGGLDSRGILGVLDQMGARPHRALSWGMREDIPGSDAWIAKCLADEFQLPFSFLPYDTDQLAEIAPEWVYVSELVNDNIGRYGEGMAAVRQFYSTGADFTFVGDEAWGWRGHAANEVEARSHVLPAALPNALRSILRAEQVNRFESLYNDSLSRVMRECVNTDATDRKDFLYLHGRVARFIFSLGYYREISSEMRRPFLSNEVLEVVRHLPKEYRVHKNLYVSMLRRFLPRTLKFPEMDVPSLPDWSYDLRSKEPVRNYFRQLLDFSNLEDSILGTMIERSAFEQARDTFFSSRVEPMNRQTSFKLRIKRAARHALVARPRLDRFLTSARRQMTPSSSGSALDPLWRIALCVLLQKNLGRFRVAS